MTIDQLVQLRTAVGRLQQINEQIAEETHRHQKAMKTLQTQRTDEEGRLAMLAESINADDSSD